MYLLSINFFAFVRNVIIYIAMNQIFLRNSLLTIIIFFFQKTFHRNVEKSASSGLLNVASDYLDIVHPDLMNLINLIWMVLVIDRYKVTRVKATMRRRFSVNEIFCNLKLTSEEKKKCVLFCWCRKIKKQREQHK